MRGFFEHQYLSFKKNHIANLVALAQIDDELHDAEIDFIYKVGRKYGLKDRHITNILNGKETIKAEIPSEHAQKVNQLFDLVGMMLADGIIEPVEIEFVNGVAKKFGFAVEIIDRLIDYTSKNQYPREDWDAFVEVVKQHAIPNEDQI